MAFNVVSWQCGMYVAQWLSIIMAAMYVAAANQRNNGSSGGNGSMAA